MRAVWTRRRCCKEAPGTVGDFVLDKIPGDYEYRFVSLGVDMSWYRRSRLKPRHDGHAAGFFVFMNDANGNAGEIQGGPRQLRCI